MFKNVASQTVTLYAVDSTTGLPKTGDGANMLFYVSKDDGAVTAIAAASGVPTEVDATNGKGLYKIALAQAETNADKLLFSGKSSTANIVVVPSLLYATPNRFSALGIDVSGNLSGSVASVAGNVGGNVVGSVASVTAAVDILQSAADKVWVSAARTLTSFGTLVASIWAAVVDSAGVTTLLSRLGVPTGASISADIAANLTAVGNLNNLSALANLFSPSQMVRPESGSVAYPFTFVVKDAEGRLVDVDTNTVTLTAKTAAGVDRSANLSAVTRAGVGEYTFTYTVATAHADEGIQVTAAGTVQSATRKAYANSEVADANSLADLATLLTRIPGTIQPQTGDAYARLGAPAGASVSADVAAVNAKTANLPATPASTTNITAGTITNLTNAPTAGDLTAAMKASVGAAVLATPANLLATDSAGRVSTTYGLHKNTALPNFEFPMVDSADHVSPKTGLSVTGTVSIDGAAFAAIANAVVEVGSGVYKVNLAAADLNGIDITLRFAAAGADATLIGLVMQG